MKPRACRLAVLAIVALLPASAHAQSFGIGPRMSFVRGELSTATPSTRFFGGTMRLSSSRRVALELALDYRTETLEGGRRLREVPFQVSMLIFPVRRAFSPYLLGGFGIYSQMTDDLDTIGNVVSTTKARETGWHLGVGAELFVSRQAAFFADYRFRYVKFGAEPEPEDDPIDIPGLGGLDLTHRGSMWTSGMAFYF